MSADWLVKRQWCWYCTEHTDMVITVTIGSQNYNNLPERSYAMLITLEALELIGVGGNETPIIPPTLTNG